jgi:TonB family protein
MTGTLPSLSFVEEAEAKVSLAQRWGFDRGRAVSASVILHLLLVLLVLVVPMPVRREIPLDQQPDPLGLIKILQVTRPETPIPVQFFPAPGAATKDAGRRPLPSDANRVAHGGDPRLPRAEVPRAMASAGIQELAEGRPGETVTQPNQERGDGRSGNPQPEPRRNLALAGLPSSSLSALTAEQAARAGESGGKAQGGGGENGGGWEKSGGFVDSGPLSFDTADYDWGSYAAELIRRIKLNWDVPSLAHYGIKGRVTVRFFLLRDGRAEGVRVVSSSGIPPYDNAAVQAIMKASPFRPLPADLGHDREGVTVTFFYNIRPEDAERN